MAPSLDALFDRLAIDDLITAYAVALDQRDWDAMTGLFAPGAVLDYTAFEGPRASVEEAVAWVAEGISGFAVSQHLCANREITLYPGGDTDAAKARCAVLNPLVDHQGRVFLVGGTYEDCMRRTPEGWRLAERVAKPAWSDFG